MTKTLLNKISKYSNDTIVTNAWLTGQTGEIVDLKGDCIFRFIDFINNGELRLKHTTEDSKLACPIVACGFIGFWLHHKDDMGVKAIFEAYFKFRLEEYEKNMNMMMMLGKEISRGNSFVVTIFLQKRNGLKRLKLCLHTLQNVIRRK